MSGRNLKKPILVLLCALIGVCALLGQSVRPAAATWERSNTTTADTGSETVSTAGYTVLEEDSAQRLSFFKRIRVNSLSGNLVIRSGADFTIRFTGDWGQKPQYQVQEKVLTINGSSYENDAESESSGTGTATAPVSGKTAVLGEDTRTGTSDTAQTAADESNAMILDGSTGRSVGGSSFLSRSLTGAANTEIASEEESLSQESGDNSASSTGGAEGEEDTEADAASLSDGPQVIVTIPFGVGLDQLWISQESGSLVITDISADLVTVWTEDGDLHAKGTVFGTVEIYAQKGDIKLSEISFNSLYISAETGDLSVQSTDGLERCKMELKTSEGSITVNGAPKGRQYLQSGNGRRSLRLQTDEGDISVRGE